VQAASSRLNRAPLRFARDSSAAILKHGLTPTADGYEVRIDSHYTWNDRIDPNPEYGTDRWKSKVAEVATLGQADPYDIHISWPAETVVRLDRNGNVISVEGYPAR
ncbi:MAG: hypothetical protein ACRD0K_22405, partial [Egibacteraceae bacterium]